ncbi:MAG: peptidase MA family metallohydrolase [Desulfobacterales bacterium]
MFSILVFTAGIPLGAAAAQSESSPAVIPVPEARYVLIGLEPQMLPGIRDAYAEARDGLTGRIGWPLAFRPTVVVVGEPGRFRAMAGGLPVSAYALGESNTMVIDYRAAVAGDRLVSLLRHELCHLVLHDRIGRPGLPRWLDEGIAQWASDGLSELVYGESRPLLQRAVLAGREIPLRRLDSAFHGDEATLRLAYAQSASLVRILADTFGDDGILRLLDHLDRGSGLEAAVRASLGIDMTEWEALWRESFRTFGGRLAALASHLYSLLFFLMALMTVAAFLRYRKRRRELAEEEDEEDAFNDS